MATYRVHMIHSVSTTVEVEADTISAAIEAATEEAPTPTNSSNQGIDPDGEWNAVAVYDEAGAEVWDDSDDSAVR